MSPNFHGLYGLRKESRPGYPIHNKEETFATHALFEIAGTGYTNITFKIHLTRVSFYNVVADGEPGFSNDGALSSEPGKPIEPFYRIKHLQSSEVQHFT